MSKDNVEIVRGIYDAWSRGNFSVGAEVLDPDIRIVWLDVVDAIDTSETRGLEAANAKMAEWVTMWRHTTLTAERILDAGDRIVVIGVWRAQGSESGVATEWRHGTVWALRDGKAIEVISHPDPADALAAAGLSE